MSRFRLTVCILTSLGAGYAATFGTVVPVIGGASDLVLDEARKQVYLVNTSKGQVEVNSTTQKKLLTPIATVTDSKDAPIAQALMAEANVKK